jgi:hypothetical protein
MEPADRGPEAWATALLFAGVSAIGLVLGALGFAEGRLQTRSGGLLSLVLPWLGALFYGTLSLIALRSPRSPWLSRAAGFYMFAHATLVTEGLLSGILCWPCLAAAGLAFAAGTLQAIRLSADRITVATGLALGAAAAFFSPVDRADDWLTRSLWPSQIISRLPAIVDRAELAACPHPSAVRLFVFEKDCKS